MTPRNMTLEKSRSTTIHRFYTGLKAKVVPGKWKSQHLSRQTSTARTSAWSLGNTENWAPADWALTPVRTSSPRHPSGKDPWNQWTTYTLTLLQLEQTTDSLAGGELAPRLSLVSPKVFSPFCHRWSFRSLPLSPLAFLVGDTSLAAQSSTWLHRYYLNWTKLDNAITKLNYEMHSADIEC